MHYSFLQIRGYDAVGVQEIVDAAGITKPTLYHYFGSKHGLLEEVLSEHFGSLNKEVEKAAQYNGDLVLTLEKTTRAFFEFSSRYPVFYRLMLSLWFAPKDSEGQKAVSIYNQHLFEDDRVFIFTGCEGTWKYAGQTDELFGHFHGDDQYLHRVEFEWIYTTG